MVTAHQRGPRLDTDMRPEPKKVSKTTWKRGIHGRHERNCGIFDLSINDLYPEYQPELWRRFCGFFTPYVVEGVTYRTFRSMDKAQSALAEAVASLCYAALEDLGDDIPDAHRQAILELMKKRERS